MVGPAGRGGAVREDPAGLSIDEKVSPGPPRLIAHPGQGRKGYGRARYHSTVLRNPSSKPVRAVKPKKRSARDVSSDRRGWPSGLVASHSIAPANPVTAAILCTRSWMLISKPAPRLTGSAPSYFSAASRIPSAASSTYRNSRVALPEPHPSIFAARCLIPSTHFLITA